MYEVFVARGRHDRRVGEDVIDPAVTAASSSTQDEDSNEVLNVCQNIKTPSIELLTVYIH